CCQGLFSLPHCPRSQRTFDIPPSGIRQRDLTARKNRLARCYNCIAGTLRGASGDSMKTIGEYLEGAIKFERMADDTADSELRASFQKQAEAYRNLAVERAKKLGIPVPEIIPKPK